MKIMDKEIKTSMELNRVGVRAPSAITRIEASIREMILEKFGCILTHSEINQILRRETERDERKDEALAKSQWNMLRSKERAILKEKIRRDAQEGKLFKKHERKEGLGVEGRMFKEATLPREKKASGITGNDKEALQAGNGTSQPLTGEPLSPFGTKPKRSGINLKQTFVNY